PEALELVLQTGLVGNEQLGHVLGIHLLGTGGEADKVAEKDGDDLALLPHRRSFDSALVGVNPEHLLQDLAHGAQRIELALLDRLEYQLELGVVPDRGLEVNASATGGER